MNLSELGNLSYFSFRKINRILSRNYRVSISESSTYDDLVELYKQLGQDNRLLKENVIDYNNDQEFVKNELMKQAIKARIRELKEEQILSPDAQLVQALAYAVVNSIGNGASVSESLDLILDTNSLCEGKNVYAMYVKVKDFLGEEIKRAKKQNDTVWSILANSKLKEAEKELAAIKNGESQFQMLDAINDPALKAFVKIKESKTKKEDKEQMKETFIKNVRAILENQIEQAEVVAAARDFSQSLQSMIEKLGRLQNESLGPVIDQMRLNYGNDVAQNFGTLVNGELEEILDRMRGSKDRIEVAVSSVAVGQSPDSASMGMDDQPPMDDMPAELPPEGDDVDAAMDDVEADLGRAKKESIERMKAAIVEAEDKLAALKKKAQ